MIILNRKSQILSKCFHDEFNNTKSILEHLCNFLYINSHSYKRLNKKKVLKNIYLQSEVTMCTLDKILRPIRNLRMEQ